MPRVPLMLASLFAIAACTPSNDNRADSAADTTRAPAVGAKAAGGSTAGVVKDSAKDSVKASATVHDAAGHDLGSLTLTDAGQGITVAGQLHGLPPGAHAIHLHVTGQCAPPFTTAGAHWNPTNKQHGMQNPQGPHFGDLQTINVSADSTVSVQLTTPGGTLRGANPLLDVDGAAVVLHAAADDNHTDPAGASGARIACGVVSGA